MAKLPKAFKRKEHGSKSEFEGVDDGKYIAKIVESSYDENKKKNGHYLKLVFELQNKKVKGRKIFIFLNLDNPNETAVEMANNELGSICDAVGKESGIKDSKELHGKPMIINVRKTENGNDILSYEPIEYDPLETVKPKAVVKLAKKIDNKKKLKKILKEYDISGIDEISDLEGHDLSSLKEDLEEFLEN